MIVDEKGKQLCAKTFSVVNAFGLRPLNLKINTAEIGNVA